MTNPTSAGFKPVQVTLEINKKYHYCTCGNSTNQPFCNGSHKGTPFSPFMFIAEKTEAKLCLCKHTKTPPFCDGNHKQLPGYIPPAPANPPAN